MKDTPLFSDIKPVNNTLTSEKINEYLYETKLLLDVSHEYINKHELNNSIQLIERAYNNLIYLTTVCDLNEFNKSKIPNLNNFI